MKIGLKAVTEHLMGQEALLRQGGGAEGQARQKKWGRMNVRERLQSLLDFPDQFFELGLWSAYEMYPTWGSLPAAGVVTGIGRVAGRSCMVIANDATVKAGAFFPQSVKKVLRAQRVAFECRLPILYLVDSSGVFLPLQDEIFPDEDDFGRIFRNNAVLSAQGIPQFAAIMGNCIAGGGYLPVLCDQLLMTKGSGLYLAGPALVQAAIGQVVTPEELGGAEMHAAVSGTVDYIEEDDQACLARLKLLVGMLPPDPLSPSIAPQPANDRIYSLFKKEGEYEMRALLEMIFDPGSLVEYKREFGRTLNTSFGRIGEIPVGILANQRHTVTNGRGEIEIGGVLYAESADKAARFVLECNQMGMPLIFLQDVMGFMVGKDAEASGIIKSGAKLISAISNSIVPKITCIVGNSFGAGHYALGGKAYDPAFIVAWPNAKYAVMGGEQARGTMETIYSKAGKTQEDFQALQESYEKQTDIRYGAARGWIDAIIAPETTRQRLIEMVRWAKRGYPTRRSFQTGVIQT